MDDDLGAKAVVTECLRGMVSLYSIVTRLLGAIFIASAMLKAISPAPAYAAVRHIVTRASPTDQISFTLQHQSINILAALLVFEIALGVLLIARWRPRFTLGVTIGALVAFSVALAVMIFDKSAPSCGCAGALRLADDARTENTIALGRNLLLVAACIWLRGRASALTTGAGGAPMLGSKP